ncbi:hypothetical protein ACE1TF_08915 [Geomicrobium sp. JSM 1781026]|uniref:hypothetical protein n=1 Tax=Geomicrobium sp. JSM 1781026 TaxID=3344580 RepID=UPI0035BEF0C3
MKPLMLVAMGVTAFTPIAADDTNEETTPFTADTFEMQPEELVEELSLVQEHTMDILMTDDYAFPRWELENFYTPELSATLHHQWNEDAYIQPFQWEDYTIVDQLLHNDVEEVTVTTPHWVDGEQVATVDVTTSSIEDGAGNRAYFDETYEFIYDQTTGNFLITDIVIEQTW